MGLESVNYISELVAANPTGADDYSTADDHIRLIKNVLQTQFPNFTAAAMTATVAELNKLDGFSGLVGDLNLLSGLDAAGLTQAEIAVLNGFTGVTADLNLLAGVDAAGLTQAELLVLNGFTGNVSDLNLLAGLAAAGLTNTELGYVKSVTSDIQTQLDAVNVPLTMYRTSSSTGRVSTTTLAVDDQLAGLTVAAGRYAVDGHLAIEQNAVGGGGFKFRLAHDGTVPQSNINAHLVVYDQVTGSNDEANLSEGDSVSFPNPSSIWYGISLKGMMVVTAGGDLQLDWAQASSDPDYTLIRQGSYISLRKMD